MGDGVGPERSRCSARVGVGSCQLHDAPYGAFCDALQLMNVWWASGSVHAFVGEEFGKLAGKKFARVVA
eukprot:3196241-Pleurochrysis_carterae.AAC.1